MNLQLTVWACLLAVAALAAIGALIILARHTVRRYPVVAVHEDYFVTQRAPLFPDRAVAFENVTGIEALSSTALRVELSDAEMPRSLRLTFSAGQPDRAAAAMASLRQRFEAFSMRQQLKRERARGRDVGFGRSALLRRSDV